MGAIYVSDLKFMTLEAGWNKLLQLQKKIPVGGWVTSAAFLDQNNDQVK